jgi:hypothetical protein
MGHAAQANCQNENGWACPCKGRESGSVVVVPLLIGHMDPNNNNQDLDLVAVSGLARSRTLLYHLWHSEPSPWAIFGTEGPSSHFWTQDRGTVS